MSNEENKKELSNLEKDTQMFKNKDLLMCLSMFLLGMPENKKIIDEVFKND